jgi:hypothetical protein
VQDEGDLNNPFIDGFRLGPDELFDKGQAGSHVDICAAGVQVWEHDLEEILKGDIDPFQVAVMPGEIDQVM